MRFRYCLPLLLILFMPTADAQQVPRTDNKAIHFPVRPTTPDVPPPAPVIPPGTPDRLRKGELYVVDSPEPFFYKQVGTGRLDVARMQGPVTIYGQFIYGGGKYEKYTAQGPHVAIFTVATGGTATLIVSPGTIKSDADINLKLLELEGEAPIPPPEPPKPPAPPVPPVPVNPYPADKLRVMMIYESESTLSAKQRGVLDSTIVKKAITDAGGEWRCWDKDAAYSKEAEFWRKAMDAGKTQALPYVIISSPKGYTEGPLPDNIQAFIATINKHKS